MSVKPGWTGRVYEDFAVGDIYEHPLGRTVLPVDNSWFTLLTQNMNPIHFDAHYAAQQQILTDYVEFLVHLAPGPSSLDIADLIAEVTGV